MYGGAGHRAGHRGGGQAGGGAHGRAAGGLRVPSKIVDRSTGKTYRTGKMLGKVHTSLCQRRCIRHAKVFHFWLSTHARAAWLASLVKEPLKSSAATLTMLFQGGFGTAYQCTCLASGKEKAVKVVARSAIRGAKEMQKVRAQHHSSLV
eukprot:COSAG06_NODE_782_length_12363_cov_27.005463_2_plen_149_part_00